MLRELEKIETQKGYIIDDFKWKKIGLNINLSSIKLIVTPIIIGSIFKMNTKKLLKLSQ